MLSGKRTAPRSCASSTNRSARLCRSNADSNCAPPSGDEKTPCTSRWSETCSLSDASAKQASRFQRARWSSHSPARAERESSWVHATQSAMSRSRSALGTKDIGSSSSTCLKSFNNSGSRVVLHTNCKRRLAFGSMLISCPRTRDARRGLSGLNVAGRPGSGYPNTPPRTFVPTFVDLVATCYSSTTSPSKWYVRVAPYCHC